MAEKKVLFFDIDGTIWNKKNFIPESTIKAFELLRKNGHQTFICSGRARGYIRNPALFALGFDGVVSGCGTMIELGGETVFLKKLDKELAVHTVETVRKHGFRPILEGWEYLYMDRPEFQDEPYGIKLMEELGERLLSIEDNWGKWEISKLSCATKESQHEKCIAELEDYYDFIIHNPFVVEVVPKGFNKGTGVKRVCELLGVDPSDVFSFGDSSNDIDMFAATGTAVAMGNASDEAKAHANYVTTHLREDGIWNACKHFELI